MNIFKKKDTTTIDNENEKKLAKKAKKNAELSMLHRIYRKFWFTLPFLWVVVFCSTTWLIIFYLLKSWELEAAVQEHTKLKNEMATYTSQQATYIKEYSEMKNYYNEYRQSLLNYNLILGSIKKYIPKEMERERILIEKKWNDVEVTINGWIIWYNAFISTLNVIDKCNFVSEETKQNLLNLNKVNIGWEKWNETLSELIAFNFKFQFSTLKNKYILQKTYDKAIKDFANLSAVLNINNIILEKASDSWSEENSTTTDNIKEIVNKKKEFLNKIWEIKQTDENWLYKTETWTTFINRMKQEQQLNDFYISYYENYKKQLKDLYENLNEESSVIYYNAINKSDTTNTNTWTSATTWTWSSSGTWNVQEAEVFKWEEVINIKENLKEKLLTLEEDIIKLYILKQYYNYLLNNNNYLNSFTNIKENTEKKYTIWDKEVTADEYILNLINTEILPEDTDLLNDTLKLYPESEREAKQKELYLQYVEFTKTIDNEKVNLLDINKYKDKYYELFYKYNNYDIVNTVLNYYITNTNFNNKFLEKIENNFLNLKIENNLLSFKNRFILNIKNDLTLKTNMLAIMNTEWFVNEMNNLESFLKETEDVYTFNNNNIECLVKDTKKDARKIYEGVLEKNTAKLEDEKAKQELDIIITAIE